MILIYRHGGSAEMELQALQERVRYYCSILTARAGRQEGRGRSSLAAVSEASLACASVQMIACVCAAAPQQLQRTCEKGIGSDHGFEPTNTTIDETHGLACRDTAV